MMRKLLQVLWILGFAVTALVYPAAWVIESRSVEVILVSPADPRAWEGNRILFELDENDRTAPDYPKKVVAIYGIEHETKRFVFLPRDRVFHPPELPTLNLLLQDTNQGEHFVQFQTVAYFAKWAVTGSGLSAIAFLVLWLVLKRRQAGRTTSGSDAPSTAA